ncbi:hypothetical protein ASD11_14680 [Aeromicrobium sp. Root495]|nr:hypothetical protein ASD11_14680 [Aeromicrobium sp. Root495]
MDGSEEALRRAAADYVAAEEAASTAAAAVEIGSAAFHAALEMSRQARVTYAQVLTEHGQPVYDGLVSNDELLPPAAWSQDDFAWADDEDEPEADAWCLTAFTGGSAEGALLRLEADEKSRLVRFADEPFDAWREAAEDRDSLMVWAFDHAGWTWVAEPYGFFGSQVKTAQRLAPRGAYVSVYWNVNGVSSLLHVVDGSVVREIDLLFAADEAVAARLPQEEGLDWAEPWSAALTLQARLVGHGVDRPDWLVELAELGFTHEL